MELSVALTLIIIAWAMGWIFGRALMDDKMEGINLEIERLIPEVEVLRNLKKEQANVVANKAAEIVSLTAQNARLAGRCDALEQDVVRLNKEIDARNAFAESLMKAPKSRKTGTKRAKTKKEPN